MSFPNLTRHMQRADTHGTLEKHGGPRPSPVVLAFLCLKSLQITITGRVDNGEYNTDSFGNIRGGAMLPRVTPDLQLSTAGRMTQKNMEIPAMEGTRSSPEFALHDAIFLVDQLRSIVLISSNLRALDDLDSSDIYNIFVLISDQLMRVKGQLDAVQEAV